MPVEAERRLRNRWLEFVLSPMSLGQKVGTLTRVIIWHLALRSGHV